jgi:predicted MPP superfamily phosphohydrolase
MVPADDVASGRVDAEHDPDLIVLGGDYVTWGDRDTSGRSPSC